MAGGDGWQLEAEMPTLRLLVLDGWVAAASAAVQWHKGAGDGARDPSANLQLRLVPIAQ